MRVDIGDEGELARLQLRGCPSDAGGGGRERELRIQPVGEEDKQDNEFCRGNVSLVIMC